MTENRFRRRTRPVVLEVAADSECRSEAGPERNPADAQKPPARAMKQFSQQKSIGVMNETPRKSIGKIPQSTIFDGGEFVVHAEYPVCVIERPRNGDGNASDRTGRSYCSPDRCGNILPAAVGTTWDLRQFPDQFSCLENGGFDEGSANIQSQDHFSSVLVT